MSSFNQLLNQVSELQRNKRRLIIAIDGQSGAGKSFLAQKILEQLQHSFVVHFDDFYRVSSDREGERKIGGDYDHSRLVDQVIEPFISKQEVVFQTYDWVKDQLRVEKKHVPQNASILIIEGVYLLLPEIRKYYDFTVWVSTPRDLRLQRGVARDGEEKRQWWIDWMEKEDVYIKTHFPEKSADICIQGN